MYPNYREHVTIDEKTISKKTSYLASEYLIAPEYNPYSEKSFSPFSQLITVYKSTVLCAEREEVFKWYSIYKNLRVLPVENLASAIVVVFAFHSLYIISRRIRIQVIQKEKSRSKNKLA